MPPMSYNHSSHRWPVSQFGIHIPSAVCISMSHATGAPIETDCNLLCHTTSDEAINAKGQVCKSSR